MHVDCELAGRSASPPTDRRPTSARLLDELDPEGSRVARFALAQASLDDVFMTLTDHQIETESETTDAR